MGDIVEFRRNRGQPNESINSSGDQKPPVLIRIPSARDLYNEERTTLEGESIANIRQKLAKYPPEAAREYLQTLEAGLTTARLEMISHDVRHASLGERNRAIAELGKYTYSVALDLKFDALREIATNMLIEGLGTWDRAARTIEGIKITKQLRKH